MKIQAIDPGFTQSAIVWWDGKSIHSSVIVPNTELLTSLRTDASIATLPPQGFPLFIEMVASYGMPVGKEVFETVLWIGRFMEASRSRKPSLVYRREVKLHHCMDSRAKDGNIRQALIDRFGDKGTKKAPGVTYGLKADLWSAFAIAVYAYDKFVGTEKLAESFS